MTLKNTTLRKFSLLAFALLLFASFPFVRAQSIEVHPNAVVVPVKGKLKVKRKLKEITSDEGTPVEKSIAVDAKVNVSLCVSEGRLKINGWERNEIRAFVDNGSQLGFLVMQRNRQNNSVGLLKVTGFDTSQPHTRDSEECLSGDEIELDVPRGATVIVKGRSSETTIETVRKVDVKNIGGDISLSNIAEGINASTYEGDVTVENSGGAISLESSNGNVVAVAVAPSEIGDAFRAKTNSGAIVLQQIGHRQAEAISISGSIKFAGELLGGGQYDLKTQNGSISLAVPEKSSIKLTASFGFGAFNSEIPLQNQVKSPVSRAQSLTATLGKGEATLNLTTYSGAIRIKKQ